MTFPREPSPVIQLSVKKINADQAAEVLLSTEKVEELSAGDLVAKVLKDNSGTQSILLQGLSDDFIEIHAALA